jgi:nitrogen fixation-related uncharacterized protein
MFVAIMLIVLALLVGLFLWTLTQCNPDDEQD